MAKYKSKTVPYSHQAYALAKIAPRKGGALLMDPGTGKTKVAVDFCGRMYMERGIERVLVIAPLTVLGIWEQEIDKHLGTMVPRGIIRLRGGIKKKTQRMEELKPQPGVLVFVITNYESCWRTKLNEQLHKFKPQCVIVDESHKIKNPTAHQSKAVYKFNEVPLKVILTGTPITKSPLDIFGQWKFLRPDVFGESWWKFKNYYAVFGGYKNYEVVSFQHLDELRDKVRHDAYFATKEECLDLPEKVYQDVEVELEPAARKLYNKMEKDFCLTLQSGQNITAPIVLTKLLRLSQISGGFITDEHGINHQISNAKFNAVKELLSLYTYPDRKVVVFARFLWEIDRISQAARELILDHVIFTGAVPIEQREIDLKRFHEDPKCRGFFAQIATGGIGIDLTPASTAIFYSLDYSLGSYIQACDRVYRIGQLHKVLYLHIITKDTVDAVVTEAIQTKQNLADLVMKYALEKVK